MGAMNSSKQSYRILDESQIALALSQSYSTRMRAKQLTRLELALSQVFSGLNESKKAAKPTLDLSRVIFTARIRVR
jgi:hypothetical protein